MKNVLALCSIFFMYVIFFSGSQFSLVSFALDWFVLMLFSEKWIFNVTQHWNWCTFCVVYHFIFTIFLLSFNRARAHSPSLFLSSSRQLVCYLPTRSHFILLENNNSSQILSLKLLNIYLLPSRRPHFNWCVCERGLFFRCCCSSPDLFDAMHAFIIWCGHETQIGQCTSLVTVQFYTSMRSGFTSFTHTCLPHGFFLVSVSNYILYILVFTFCFNCSDISRDFFFILLLFSPEY